MSNKILYLSPNTSLFGAGKSLLLLLERLDKHKYSPIVVCSKEGDLVRELKAKGIQTVLLRFRAWRKLRNIPFIPSILFSLVQLIKREKIELIHCNEFWLNPYGVIVAKITRVPCITHIRISLDKAKIQQYYLRWTDRLITVSNSIRKPLDNFSTLKDKVVTIYNGVDTKKFNPNIRSDRVRIEFNIPQDSIIIGIIGELCPRKGQKTFLEAASQVLKNRQGTKFMIVGRARKEWYEGELKKLAEDLNIGADVIFTGFRDDIPEILAAMDVFVLPSLQEGFPRSIIEAMAVGKPVIATSAGGNSEAIIDGVTGFIIPLNNPQILAERILELLDDRSKMQKMGKEGRKRVEENFTAEHYVENIEKVYTEFLR